MKMRQEVADVSDIDSGRRYGHCVCNEKTDRDVGFGSELCGEFQKCAGRVFRICPPTGVVGYFTTFL